MNEVEYRRVETADGESLRAWVTGPADREPILLITGGSSDGRSWRFLVPELLDSEEERRLAPATRSLAERHRVVGYDQRGTGTSSGTVPPDSSRLAADHALAVGRSVLGDRFHVVGHSLGGMAALRLAIEHPDTVASLVLMATSAGGDGLTMPDPAFLANITGSGAGDARERARENLALSVGPNFPTRRPELFEHLVDDILDHPAAPDSWVAQATTFATHDVTADLASLRIPTLVLCGTEDKVMCPPNSRYLAAHIPNATLIEIDGAGHALDIEAADQVTAAISRHVDQQPVSSR